MNKLKLASLIATLITLTSCKDADDIRGRYHGILKMGAVVKQVVTEVPNFKEAGAYQVLNFSVYETLASAKPNRVNVQLDDDFVIVRSSFLGQGEYRLKRQGDNCGAAETEQTVATLCIQVGAIDFRIKEKSTGNLSLNLNLVRNGDLPVPPGIEAQAGVFSIDEVIGRAKFSNYSVVQEAEKVYQARQKIKMAIGNLLPRFNLKDLLSFAGGPLGGIEAIGNLVPFIFPSNWYKWGEAEELDKAQSKSFASLRGNEIQFVENIFYLIQRDQLLFTLMQQELVKQRETHRIIEKKERYGLLPQKSAEKYYTNILLMEQDLTELESLVKYELASLGHAVALPPATGINQIKNIPLPDLTKAVQLDHKKLIEVAQKKSFEVATFGYLIEASKRNRKVHAWGFLDPNSDDTIGFGYASMLNVGESQERILASKQEEVISTIEQKVYSSVTEYNASLYSFKLSQTGVATAQARLERLAKRLQTGDEKIDDEYFVQEMVEASQSLLKFTANRLSSIHSYFMARSKLNRLLLEEYYDNLELFTE